MNTYFSSLLTRCCPFLFRAFSKNLKSLFLLFYIVSINPTHLHATEGKPIHTPPAPINLAFLNNSLDSIGMIIGATYHPDQNYINLIGDGEHTEASPTLQQIAVAFSWAFSDSVGYNFLSIDPISSSPNEKWMKIRMAEMARNTDFGYIMLEADRIMKTISLAKDNITKLPVLDFPCKSLFDISTSEQDNSNQEEVWSRFWLYPHLSLAETSDQSILIKEARMGVLTEKMQWVNGELKSIEGAKDPEADAFAKCFTESYQAIADKELIFRQLEQLMRLLLISEWIREKNIPIALDWVNTYRDKIFQMPLYTPTISNQRSNQGKRRIIIQHLFGGTDLNVKPRFTSQSASGKAWEVRAKKASMDFNEAGKFSFQSGSQSFSALSFPTFTHNVSPRKIERVISIGPPNGPTIDLYKKAVSHPENHNLALSPGWEIALPKMIIYNPHGRNGETRYVNDIPERNITLYDPAGNLLGRFSNLDFDRSGNAFMKADNPAYSWQIYPDKNGEILWAVKDNTIWAFDSETALFVGQQIGDQLIHYQWSFFSGPFNQSILTEIRSNEHFVKFEHGNGGLKITGLTTSDGRKIDFIQTDAAEMVAAEIYHFSTLDAGATKVNINTGNGNWELIGERNIADNYYFLNRHGIAVGQILANANRRKRPYTLLFPDGGHTLIISNGKITIMPLSISDFLRKRQDQFFQNWSVEGIKKMKDGKTKVLLRTGNEDAVIYLANREKDLTHYFFGEEAKELFKYEQGQEEAENTVLAMKSISNMPEDMGVTDLRITDGRMTYSGANGQIEFDNISLQRQRDINGVEEYMESFYEKRRNPDFNIKHFETETRPYFEFLQSIADKTRKKTYLTKEYDHLDANLIWMIHEGNRSIKFRRDHDDIQKSIDFYISPVYLERDSFYTLSTFDWHTLTTSGQYHQLEELANEVGVIQESNVDWNDFLDIMRDSTKRQITVFTQADENGLIFADQNVNFQEIARELNALDHTKDLINIVVDRRKGVQRLFADSGKFRRVTISGCDYQNANSVAYAMRHLEQAYHFFNRKAELSTQQFGNLVSSFTSTDVKAIIGDKLSVVGDKVTIKVGQLTQTQKRHLTFGFMDGLKNYIRGDQKEYNKPISTWIDQTNEEKIRRLYNEVELNSEFMIKSILRLKVFNVPDELKDNLLSTPFANTIRYG